MNCGITTNKGVTALNVNGNVHRDLPEIFIDAVFLTERRGHYEPFIRMAELDLCSLLGNQKHSAPIVNIIKDVFAKGGELPTCPLMSGYYFEYNNLNVDPSIFPFLPEVKFVLFSKIAARLDGSHRVEYARVNLTGEVVRTRSPSLG